MDQVSERTTLMSTALDVIESARKERQGEPRCKQFALCANSPDGTVTHPILGEVPTCQRCADKLGLDIS